MRWFFSYTLPLALAATAAAAEEAGQDRDLLALHPSESAYTVVIFLLFFGALSFFVWPKVLKALQAREEKQRSDLKAAENAAKEAQAALAEYQQQLASARKEAQAIIEQSRKDAQGIGAQVTADAEARAKQITERAQADIAAAREQAIASIYEQAAGLATQIAAQILKREIDPAAHQALVDESLQQLAATRN